MKTCVMETDILVSFPNIDDEGVYDLQCYDGYAIGIRTCDSEEFPATIRMEYPLLADILDSEEAVNHVLTYRGLWDLSAKDIHYGDVMMAYGSVAN